MSADDVYPKVVPPDQPGTPRGGPEGLLNTWTWVGHHPHEPDHVGTAAITKGGATALVPAVNVSRDYGRVTGAQLTGSAGYFSGTGHQRAEWTHEIILALRSTPGTEQAIWTIASSPGGSARDRSFDLSTSGRIDGYIYSGGGQELATKRAVRAYELYHLFMSIKANDWRIFINGVQEGETTSFGDGGYTGYSGTPDHVFGYGSRNNVATSVANIYLAREYDRALTPGEIIAITRNPWQWHTVRPSLISIPAAAAGGAVTSTGAQTLPAVTQAGTGTVVNPVTSTGAQTLPAVTQAGTGAENIQATGAQSLPSLTQAATAAVANPVTSTGAQTLPAVTQAGTGIEDIPGTGAQTLPAVTQAATASHDDGTVGTGDQTLPAVTQAGTGLEDIPSTGAQTLPAVTQASTATVANPVTSTGAQTLPGVTQAGTGAHALAVTSTGAQVLPFITMASTAIGGEVAEVAAADVPGGGSTNKRKPKRKAPTRRPDIYVDPKRAEIFARAGTDLTKQPGTEDTSSPPAPTSQPSTPAAPPAAKKRAAAVVELEQAAAEAEDAATTVEQKLLAALEADESVVAEAERLALEEQQMILLYLMVA